VTEGARLWSGRRDGADGPTREWRWGRRRRLLVLYVDIPIPQIPLFKINGVVNQFSARRAKEREI
jgi:hypothetical protein